MLEEKRTQCQLGNLLFMILENQDFVKYRMFRIANERGKFIL